MFTCEQRDRASVSPWKHSGERSALRKLPREMHGEKGGKKERKKEGDDREEEGKDNRERGSARYQVPVPSRHHGGITVSGCPIGFNRKRLSRAAEFCKETTASLSSRPSIYGYYPFALEHQSTQRSAPSRSVLLHNSASGSRSFDKEDSGIILHRRLSHFANGNLKFYTREITSRQTVCDRTRF